MVKKNIYCPLTATPFKKNKTYTEIAPNTQLAPYIRCFWGTEKPYVPEAKDADLQIVIPDTCADVIYFIDYTDQTVSGGFCGVNDRSFYSYGDGQGGHLVATFAIRFFAWEAYVFAEDSLKDTLNGYHEVGERFEWLDRRVRSRLLELKTLQEKAAYVEQILMEKAQSVKENEIVKNAVNQILASRGSMEVSGLAKESFVSSRHLERLFHEYVGVTPKKLSSLIRYQLLWRDILSDPDFDVLNAVHKYGYTDQPHLLHEFKRYHSMDIYHAKMAALKDVANIQDAF